MSMLAFSFAVMFSLVLLFVAVSAARRGVGARRSGGDGGGGDWFDRGDASGSHSGGSDCSAGDAGGGCDAGGDGGGGGD